MILVFPRTLLHMHWVSSDSLAVWVRLLSGTSQIGSGVNGHGRSVSRDLPCAILLLLLMQHHPTPLLLYLMVAAQGLLGYGMASVFGSVPVELFQGKQFGTIASMLSVPATLGAATGPWVTGLLYDRTGSYTLAFWICAGMSLIAIVGMWMAAPRKVRVVAGQVARLREQRRLQGQAETA